MGGVLSQDTKYLIVGGDGLIGGAIFDLLARRSAETYRTTRRPAASAAALVLDLAAPDCSVERVPGLARLLEGGPLVVFLAAAISGYGQCEADPAATRQVNVVNLSRIAGEFVRRGAFVVFPSSSAVFSGVRPIPAETDATDPVSEYGRQKAEIEERLRVLSAGAAAGGGIAIVRLSKVVARGTGIIASWIGDLSAGRTIEAARDLEFAPISLPYAARHLVSMGESRQSGTFHLSGARAMAYFEFAGLLAARLGAGWVEPVAIRDRVGASALPQVAALDMNETTARTGIRPQQAAEVVAYLFGGDDFPGDEKTSR